MGWLNSKDAGQPRADIAEALTIFQEVQGLMNESGKNNRFDVMVAHPDVIVKTQRVQGLLANYTFRTALMPDINSCSFRWFPAWEEADRFISDLHFGKYGLESALLAIMRLAEKGLLSRVKQCNAPLPKNLGLGICGKWIFAKFPQEQYCVGSCRSRGNRAKPGWREDRREWRRANRKARELLESGGKTKPKTKKRG